LYERYNIKQYNCLEDVIYSKSNFDN
jgi:hypothetical protein